MKDHSARTGVQGMVLHTLDSMTQDSAKLNREKVQ